MKVGEIMSFQDNLKQYREKAGFSAKDFAKKIGCAYTTYLTYENQGREPRFELLTKIAKTLHVSIDDLLGYHPSELEIALRDLQECGFFVIGKETAKNGELSFNIMDSEPDELGGDNAFFIPSSVLIELHKEITKSQEATAFRRTQYTMAFNEMQKQQIEYFYELLKNDPDYKEVKKQLEKINPDFFNEPLFKDKK